MPIAERRAVPELVGLLLSGAGWRAIQQLSNLQPNAALAIRFLEEPSAFFNQGGQRGCFARVSSRKNHP